MMARDILKMDNVRIIQPNFAGRGGMYNREGDRNFLVVLDSVDIANELARDGWNVKIKEPREEGCPFPMFLFLLFCVVFLIF